MAKIFISHSTKDKKLVKEYLPILRNYGHEILMDDTLLKHGDDMAEVLY